MTSWNFRQLSSHSNVFYQSSYFTLVNHGSQSGLVDLHALEIGAIHIFLILQKLPFDNGILCLLHLCPGNFDNGQNNAGCNYPINWHAVPMVQ